MSRITPVAGLLCLALTACSALADVEPARPRVVLETAELRAEPDLAELPAIPWVEQGDATWKQSPPAWEIVDREADTRAVGWYAVSDDHILIKVVVSDQQHVNVREGGDIWDGDALQIGVDARGDGSGPLPADSRLVRPDDASITVALTKEGTRVWAHFQGKYGTGYLAEGGRDYPCAVSRDEEAESTTYQIAFPWEDFLAQPGPWPTIGLCIQVNDTDEGAGQTRLYWGRGADGEPRPGLFKQLRVGAPSHQMAAVVVTKQAVWRRGDAARVRVALASPDSVTIRTSLNGAVQERGVPGRPIAAGVRRFDLEAILAELPDEPMPLSARVVAADGTDLATAEGEITAPGLVMGELHRRVEHLAAESPHPLFTRHLRSVDALVQAEWNRALLFVDELPSRAGEAVEHAETILNGLDEGGAMWDAQAAGGRGLVLARIAGSEQSLQFYTLTLPEGWDPERTYPLIVSLHGAGPTHPLFYVAVQFETPDEGESEDQQDEADLEPHFTLAPWGRGNNGYSEQGEDDVWQALQEVRRDFRVDGERIYLTGHSMGGGGTWHIALRTPDVWAAACPVSGGTWGLPPGRGVGVNGQHLPFRIWHGEADGAVSVDNAYAMQAELRRYGNEPEMVIVPEQGHGYPGQARLRNHRWLLRHRRRRPDEFSYVADTDRHRGVWGIWMARDIARDPLPRFDCRIQGSAVYINSEGTSGLDVDLGPEGLGMRGEVTVFWNGKETYQGPPGQIELGEGGGWRP